jgi:hypothetical protein
MFEGSALKWVMVISYPVCFQFAVHMKRQCSVKYLHQVDSISGVNEGKTN